VVGTALSPIAPLGEARIAETSTGITFDTPILLLGALATVAVVLALGLWPALRAAHTLRPDDRPGIPSLRGGEPSRRDRCTAERGDRCPQRPRAKERWGARSGGERPSRHGAGGDRAVRDGGLRRQSFAPHGHPQAVRR
jgi:hypothetical protein